MHYKVFAVMIAAARLLRADLIANVAVTPGPPIWSYTLFNDEPSSSPEFITSFSLTVNAPITVTGTPAGWDVSTDGDTFVSWFNTDPALPYPHDIAPGASLSGFSISSTTASSQLLSYGLSAWDHTLDQLGPSAVSTISAPSVAATVPETASGGLVTFCIFGFIVWRRFTAPKNYPKLN